ncbi:MAG: flippase-like domain-containing protein [Deltaproteobacteria bacterium]|nr:flippase-like domain-containing protein [Deltaproteobacteria bacterium]
MNRPLSKDSSVTARGLLKSIVLATVLSIAVFAVLSIYSDVRQLQANLAVFTYCSLAFAFLLASGNYGVRFIRWQYYLRHIDIIVPSGESALVFLSGFVMSVTPGKFGEVFKSLLLYESRRISIAKTAPIVVAERLTDLMALVVLIALGSLSFKEGIPITISGASVVALILMACAFRPIGDFFLALFDKLPLTKRVGPKLREAYNSLLEMTRLWPLLVGTVIGVVAWGMECAALYVIVLGFGVSVLSWDAATFAYSTSTMAGALAMMPGGLGVTEIGMAGLLRVLGGSEMTISLATAATILVRIATLWYAVVIGIIALGIRRILSKP